MEHQLGHSEAETGIIKREGLTSPHTDIDSGVTSSTLGRESGRRIASGHGRSAEALDQHSGQGTRSTSHIERCRDAIEIYGVGELSS
jgi:hypothetical protein